MKRVKQFDRRATLVLRSRHMWARLPLPPGTCTASELGARRKVQLVDSTGTPSSKAFTEVANAVRNVPRLHASSALRRSEVTPIASFTLLRHSGTLTLCSPSLLPCSRLLDSDNVHASLVLEPILLWFPRARSATAARAPRSASPRLRCFYAGRVCEIHVILHVLRTNNHRAAISTVVFYRNAIC